MNPNSAQHVVTNLNSSYQFPIRLRPVDSRCNDSVLHQIQTLIHTGASCLTCHEDVVGARCDAASFARTPQGVFTLGDSQSFLGLTSKIPPLHSMSHFDADVR